MGQQPDDVLHWTYEAVLRSPPPPSAERRLARKQVACVMPKLCVYARNSASTPEILGKAIAESTDLDAAEAQAVADIVLRQEPPSYVSGTANHLLLLEQIADTLREHGFTVSIGP